MGRMGGGEDTRARMETKERDVGSKKRASSSVQDNDSYRTMHGKRAGHGKRRENASRMAANPHDARVDATRRSRRPVRQCKQREHAADQQERHISRIKRSAQKRLWCDEKRRAERRAPRRWSSSRSARARLEDSDGTTRR